MYAKENEGASTSSSTPSCSKKFNVPELMHQLQVTQNELENIKVSFSIFKAFGEWKIAFGEFEEGFSEINNLKIPQNAFIIISRNCCY